MSETPDIEVDLIVEADLPPGADLKRLDELARFVLATEGRDEGWAIALVLTTDAKLRALHRDYMGIDSETDVMTFPSEPEPGSSKCGGDIVISMERATEQAVEFDHSVWDEVTFLAAHGVLHLCGWRDESTGDREAMLERQQRLIADFERAQLD